MGDSVLASGLGLIFWTFAARFYTETDVGLASTLISSIGLLAIASTLGFTVGLIRFLPMATDEEYSKMINSCFTVSSILAVILAIIFIIGLDVWSPALNFLKSNIFIVIIFVLFALALTLTALMNGIFIAARKAEYVLLKNSIIASALKLILLIALSIITISLAYLNIYFAWGVAAIVAVLVSIFIFLPKTRKSYRARISVETRSINHMMRFSAGNYAAIFFLQAPILILPLMITNMLSAEITAYFYLTWMMANLLFFIPSAVGTSLLSEMSYEEVNYDEKTIRAAKFIALLLIPGIILFLVLGDRFLLLFGASYSANASTALMIFTISSIPLAVNAIYVTVKNAMKQVRYVILVNATIAIGTLGSSYLVMSNYGLLGIAFSWLASQSFVATLILLSLLVKKVYKAI
jgi:O-antigen/teichoic acid export membrane protein